MECVVCFTDTSYRTIPCAHPLCSDCIKSWMQKGRVTCPVCRGTFVGHTSTPKCKNDLVISFSSGPPHAGVTFADHSDGGVKLIKLDEKDQGKACGLRVGDRITHLNGLAIHDHKSAIAMVQKATDKRIDVACRVAKTENAEWCHTFRLWMRKRAPRVTQE